MPLTDIKGHGVHLPNGGRLIDDAHATMCDCGPRLKMFAEGRKLIFPVVVHRSFAAMAKAEEHLASNYPGYLDSN